MTVCTRKEKLSEVKDVSYLQAVNPLVKTLNRFIYLFNWIYSDLTGELAKNPTYALQSAVDDVNSFLGAPSFPALRIPLLICNN